MKVSNKNSDGEKKISNKGNIVGRLMQADNESIKGWVYNLSDPKKALAVDIELDGRKIANVLAEEVNFTFATGNLSDAGSSSFVYVIPSYLIDDRGHILQVREAITGCELEGSPRPVHLVRKEVTQEWPLKTAAEIGAAVHTGRKIEVVSDKNKLENHIYFELDDKQQWVEPESPSDLATTDPQLGGLLIHRRFRSLPPYLLTVRNAYVHPAHGKLLFDDGTLWAGCINLSNRQVVLDSIQKIKDKSELRQVKACIIISGSLHDNYFHWHIDCLSALHFLCEILQEHDIPVLGPKLNHWQKESLDYQAYSNYVEVDDVVKAETVFLSSYTETRGINPDHHVGEMFTSAKQRWLQRLEHPIAAGPDRIFISRADSPRRIAKNEKELSDKLESIGFQTVLLSNLRYKDQINLFHQAKVIVASHGAGLTNIGFCQPRTTIIEIIPKDYHNGCFRFLAIRMKLRHYWVPTGTLANFQIDVAAVMRVVAAEGELAPKPPPIRVKPPSGRSS